MLLRLHLDGARIVLGCHLNGDQMGHRWRSDGARMIARCCWDCTQMALGWCSDGARIVLGWCSDGTWIELGLCLDCALMAVRWRSHSAQMVLVQCSDGAGLANGWRLDGAWMVLKWPSDGEMTRNDGQMTIWWFQWRSGLDSKRNNATIQRLSSLVIYTLNPIHNSTVENSIVLHLHFGIHFSFLHDSVQNAKVALQNWKSGGMVSAR